MQIVIDIPEEIYNSACATNNIWNMRMTGFVCSAIANGTPLPKEHGRLIDADVLVDGMEDDYEFCEAVNATPTIIEAESEDT